MKSTCKWLMRKAGFEVVNLRRPGTTGLFPHDFDHATIETCLRVRPFTMTSPERVHALVQAVQYVLRCKIPGSFVECGVWKGGSTMAIAMTLLKADQKDRELCLFDTFEGMTQPIEADGAFANEQWAQHQQATHNAWAYAPLKEVKANMKSTGYPQDNIHYIVGKVEDTLPDSAPQQIALLRLDTDFYQSTKHELEHLFPRLSPGGVLIIDDYGTFVGARRAVDEYIQEKQLTILLNRIDADSRIAVKM